MSADNFVAIMPYGGKWHVFDASASCDRYSEPWYDSSTYRSFVTREEARSYAFKLELEDYYEYGVSEITPTPKDGTNEIVSKDADATKS